MGHNLTPAEMANALGNHSDLTRLEAKIDKLAPIIEALGDILVRRQTVIDRTGISKNVFNDRPAFEEIGKRKTYIEIGEIGTVKRRKRK